MAARRGVAWLYRELPALVDAGVVPPEVAERIRAHYGAPGPGLTALPVFAILGSALIGLGVVLLVAHNWDELPRAARAALCFALLLGAQGLAVFALARRRASVGWTESGGVVLGSSLAAAMSLIAQTYQVPGDLASFLRTWLLLMLPVVYALDTRVTAVLWIVALGSWALADTGSRLGAAGFTLAILPYLAWLDRGAAASHRSAFLGWAAVLVLPLSLAGPESLFDDPLAPALAASLAGGVWALGAGGGEQRAERYYGRAARWAGALGIGFVLVAWSFSGTWEPSLDEQRAPGTGRAVMIAVCAVFAAVALASAWRALAERRPEAALAGGLPLAMAAIHGVAWLSGSPVVAMLLVNAYGLALGVAALLAGLRAESLGATNAAMLLLGALIAARFTDLEWSFTLRGLAFIALGSAFLAVNVWIGRRRGAAA